MKQCVICRQLFADDNLRFCRFDGTPLVDEVVPPDERATILFTSGQLHDLFEELRHKSGSGKLYE
jgi:hypothetical protein